jgi:hypothetical protein
MVKKIIKALQKANNRYPLFIFYLLTFAIAFAFYYHVILFSPPQSVHRWRQTDSASMTLNLYQPGYTLRGIRDNTSYTICRLIDLGARYLVINDTSYLSMPEIKPFTNNQVGEYNEVRIFRVEACLNKSAEGNNQSE